ncbi:chlorophyll a/b-binding protein [Fragilariopsis cylindrus CCMP1102]|uniref:Chlorophyll a/b-binding protein n=1 Tax=Fragilariopsis cylindrus CCMP1102 TaxID=635003 RepID=A0A1E7EX55_9STRA|nr:chlorophyll a/b-binding protein [Fragilariopsis cylindrus CCMP1102]|eukprot:OEU10103.1 chlorophyll a/b-binding protein [Fragilariopsis cylindrus CCMP1102]
MKSSITFLALATVSSVSAFAPTQSSGKSSSTKVSLTKEEILSSPNNLELGEIFDPLGLSELGGDETLSWFRHSEVKHGRVAMAAFVGWCATAGAGLRFPGELAHGLKFADVPGGGVEAWDATPGWGKAQLLLFAGLIEFHDEIFYSRRATHYLKGGIPGKNMVPGLYDPFNLSAGKTEETLARGRDVEIKNGRLAMIGIAGLYFASVIPGSVPFQP